MRRVVCCYVTSALSPKRERENGSTGARIHKQASVQVVTLRRLFSSGPFCFLGREMVKYSSSLF